MLSIVEAFIGFFSRITISIEVFEAEDGHVRVYPPAGLREEEIAEIERKLADRCLALAVEKGVFLWAAVYD